MLSSSKRMFNVNLSDSQGEENQNELKSDTKEQQKFSHQNPEKQQINSKINQTEQQKNNEKNVKQTKKKQNFSQQQQFGQDIMAQMLRLKSSMNPSTQKSKPLLKKLSFNKKQQQNDPINKYQKQYNARQFIQSARNCLKGEKRNDKVSFKQRKKIDLLNEEFLSNDLEEINLIHTQRNVNKELFIDIKGKQFKINRDLQISKSNDEYSRVSSFKQKQKQKQVPSNKDQQHENQKESKKPKIIFQKIVQHDLNPNQNQTQQVKLKSKNSQQKQPQQTDQKQSIGSRQSLQKALSSSSNKSKQQEQNRGSKRSNDSQQSKQKQFFQATFNIFNKQYISNAYLQQSYEFFQYLLCSSKDNRLKYEHNVKLLLLKPIPKNKVFTFIVQVYKDLLKTQYQLWIQLKKNNSDKEGEMILLARSYNPNISIDRAVFVVEQIGLNNDKMFIGQIQSNFTRDSYTLYGYKVQDSKKKMENVKSTFSYYENQEYSQIQNQNQLNQQQESDYFQSRPVVCFSNKVQQLLNAVIDVYRMAYIPKLNFSQKQKNDFYHVNLQDQKGKKSLQKQHEQQQKYFKSSSNCSIQKLITRKLFTNQQFNQTYGIRQSNKTLLLLKNQSKNHVVFIGKIASKKYKLMCGQDISPLQAFGFLVAHVENNLY